MDVRSEGTTPGKSEAAEQWWRREGAGINFSYSLTRTAFVCAATRALLFEYATHSHKAQESPCSANSPGHRDAELAATEEPGTHD